MTNKSINSCTSDYIYKESLKEFNCINNCCHENINIYKITLDTINKINGIDVECELLLNKIISKSKKNEYYIGIWIEGTKIFINNTYENHNMFVCKEKLHKYNSAKINDFLTKLKNKILPNLRVDKVFGKFYLVNEEGKKIINEDNVGIDIFGLEYSNSNDCVVCYESTYTLTSCNHYLCVDCWNKLKNNNCPMCRCYLTLKSDNDTENNLSNSTNLLNQYQNNITGNDDLIDDDDSIDDEDLWEDMEDNDEDDEDDDNDIDDDEVEDVDN